GGGVTGMLAFFSLAAGAGLLVNHFCSMVDEGNLPGEILGYVFLGLGLVFSVATCAAELYGQYNKNSDDPADHVASSVAQRVDPASMAMAVNGGDADDEEKIPLLVGNGFARW
ncbi:MAG: hypothetical protein KAS93_07545, partial [Gammaproteobacteria bacterium]|nr:hypothetical protein [Gammaproteobacteria bacterium]